jgi:hypothetical protein
MGVKGQKTQAHTFLFVRPCGYPRLGSLSSLSLNSSRFSSSFFDCAW